MRSLPLVVYAASAVILFLKYFLVALVQARGRLGGKTFRHPEDAAHWGGEVAEDPPEVLRAQRLLRNDGESQPFFLVLGGLYLALEAWPAGAPWYFGLYALSRCAHALFFLRPLQPHRNRAYVLGLAILFALAGHVVFEAASRLL